jgi:hypothetical protein
MLPKNLQYMNKVESASARQYTSTVQPENGTGNYLPNTKCRINIPTSPNTVLVPSESYLKFDIGGVTVGGVNAANYIRLDKCGAHGCIQRCRVIHGSTEIQDLDNYGAIVAEMMALQQTSDGFSGKQNVMCGTAPGSFLNGATTEILLTTVGERLNQTYAVVGTNATVPNRTYALNLMSYVGSLSGGEYIPLFEMTSAPLSIEITFVSSLLKFLCVSTALANNNFVISNVEFVGTFIELSDDAIASIRQSQGGQPLQYVIQNYSNVNTSATLYSATSTSVNLPVSARYASLKSLFCIPRRYADGLETSFPYSSTHFNINQWRVKVGNLNLPSKAPNSMVEHYSELIKAIGSLSDINHEPSINWHNYNAINPSANTEGPTAGAVTARSMCFALGFDLESYAGADKDRIFSGMNTQDTDIFWSTSIDFFGNGIADIVVRFDTYASDGFSKRSNHCHQIKYWGCAPVKPRPQAELQGTLLIIFFSFNIINEFIHLQYSLLR